MSSRYSYSYNKNSGASIEDRRSFDISHGTRGVNISVGNKKNPHTLEIGEFNQTITLNKTQLELVIATLKEIHSILEDK